MANCDYGRTIGIEVCTAGPVGGGDSSNMSVRVTDSGLISGSSKILTKTGWDGSSTTFNGWVDMFPDCSTVVSSSMTVILGPGDNRVTVGISITVDNCGGTPYSNCGGPGPHTFADSQTYLLNVPGACGFAIGP